MSVEGEALRAAIVSNVESATGNDLPEIAETVWLAISEAIVNFTGSTYPIGTGTPGKLARWTTSSQLGDSITSDNGVLFTVSGNQRVTGSFQLDGNGTFGNTGGDSHQFNGNTEFNHAVIVYGTSTFNDAVTVNHSQTFSLFTEGSIPFIGPSGLVSQDNANLFWDNSNNRLGIGTDAPDRTLVVKGADTNHLARFQNTNASGYSALNFEDESATDSFGIGYSNGANEAYLSLNGPSLLVSTVGNVQRMRMWANGNFNFGPTNTDPGIKFSVEATTSDQAAARFYNTSTSGYSALSFMDSSAGFKGLLGYGNSAVAATYLQNNLFLYSAGTDFVFANAKNNLKIGMTDNAAFIEYAQGDSAAVSASNTGRQRYNVASQRFEFSHNGSAYVNAVTGAGTNNYITKWSGTTGTLVNAASGTSLIGSSDSDTLTTQGIFNVIRTGADSNPSMFLTNDVQTWRVGNFGSLSDAFSVQDTSSSANNRLVLAPGSNRYAGVGNMGSTGGTLPQYPWEVYDSTAGQTVAAITDAGSRAGLLAVVNGTAAGSGGGIVFGSAATHVAGVLGFAAIKGFLNSGANNSVGDLVFTTRNATTDIALTERMRIAQNGNVTIQQATQLGATGSTTLAHIINGSITATSTDSTFAGANFAYTPVAGTTTGAGAIFTNMAGTANTTAGAITYSGINLNATTTRSAGANDLFVNGLNISASGGTNVRGARIAITGSVPTSYGAFITNASTAGTAEGIEVQVTGAATTNTAALLTATGAATNNALQTINGDIRLATTSGNLLVGYSSGTSPTFKADVSGNTRLAGSNTIGSLASTHAHSINGWTLLSASHTTANNALQIGYAPTGSTNGQSALRILDNGTFDTTAGALFTWGVRASATATRSAGANTLTNICGEFDASGAQVNTALRTINGNVLLNLTSGITNVGFSSATAGAFNVSGTQSITSSSSTSAALAITHTGANNSAVTSTYTPTNSTVNNLSAFQMAAAGTYDTTASSLNAYGLNLSATGTRSAGANNFNNIALICGAANGQTNTAIRTTTGDNQFNFNSGNTNIGTSGGTAKLTVLAAGEAFLSTSNVTGRTTTLDYHNLQAAGTFDTTAGSFNASGLRVVINSTRSAGAGNLTNNAVRVSSSGAQVNIAFRSDVGDNYYNTTSGATAVGYAAGAALPATFSVTGTGYFSSDVEIDGAFNHDGSTFGALGATPIGQTAITLLTDNTLGTANNTLQALTNPAAAPVDATALRDDLVANLIPELRNNYADVAAKLNEVITMLKNLGFAV